MSEVDHDPAPWPPYPTVLMGAGSWRYIIAALNKFGTKRAAEMAARIERDINKSAARIADSDQRVTP